MKKDNTKLVCDGNSKEHQCEKRKCQHRKEHNSVDGCGKHNFNYSDFWCERPGTVSILDGYCDGSLVKCIRVNKKT